ncbi:G-type lectin S-receptor-like serine/threonine-protein kinase At2g19130 [Linum perenne]
MASLRINHHFITLAVAATALLNSVTSGFRYIIGDSIWAVPPSSDFYSSWSFSHNFYVGDSIVFEFGIELFNVIQVMRNDYESCIADAPLKVYRSSPAVIELTYKGAFYYICNVSNYCDLGQKVSIVVFQRPPSSAPMPSPSSPLPSGSPPPPPPSFSSSTSPLPSGSPSPPSSMLPPSIPIVPIPDPFPSPGVAAEPSQDGENNHSPPPGASDSSSSISNRASSMAGVYFLIGLVVIRILNSNIVAFFDSRVETWICTVELTTNQQCVCGSNFSQNRRPVKSISGMHEKFLSKQRTGRIAKKNEEASTGLPLLRGNADIEELKRVCRVGVWCIQDDESHRPTMSQVVYILEQVLEVNIPPVPRILQRFVDPDSGYY